MCVTKELKHTVCQHTDSYTERCLSARSSPSFLRAFVARLSSCTRKTQAVALYDLCHDCRRYWAAHGVSERQATRSYVSYRRAHDYDGPLAPRLVLMAGGEGDEDEGQGQGQGRARGGGSGVKGQFPSSSSFASAAGLDAQGMQNITPWMYGRSETGRRASEASVRTQWPSPQDLRREPAQRTQLQARDGMGKGKGKEVVRDRDPGAKAGVKGVVLLSEDEDGPPTWF